MIPAQPGHDKTPISEAAARRWAYGLALIGAPVAVAILGFWFLLIPVFAVYFGGIPYLVLAGPAFWLALRKLPPNPVYFAAIGFALNLLTPVLYAVNYWYRGLPYPADMIGIIWKYGAVFSALWGAMFALLFQLFCYILIRRPKPAKGPDQPPQQKE